MNSSVLFADWIVCYFADCYLQIGIPHACVCK